MFSKLSLARQACILTHLKINTSLPESQAKSEYFGKEKVNLAVSVLYPVLSSETSVCPWMRQRSTRNCIVMQWQCNSENKNKGNELFSMMDYLFQAWFKSLQVDFRRARWNELKQFVPGRQKFSRKSFGKMVSISLKYTYLIFHA